MIKNSSFDFSYDYLRFDTTWLFEWDVNNVTDDTIRFYPFTEVGKDRTWYFCAKAGPDGKESTTVVIKHNEFVWNPLEPWLEYDMDRPADWDRKHPDNITRFLNPDSSYVTLSNTVETVIIDNIPPAFISDKGTEYVWICDHKSRADVKRHCEFVFRDQAGLDFKQFEIKVGDITLYRYARKEDELYSTLDAEGNVITPNQDTRVKFRSRDKHIGPDGTEVYEFITYDIADYRKKKSDGTTYIDQSCIDRFNADIEDRRKMKDDKGFLWYEVSILEGIENLKISSDGYHTYKVAFDLLYGQTDGEVDELNTYGLSVKIWDKAGNNSTYKFGDGMLGKKWVLIDTVDDISDLQPMVIKFYDHDPKNMIVDESSYGSVWVSIFNPNVEFYEAGIPIIARLAGGDLEYNPTEHSITDASAMADIDMTTFDDSEYEDTGVIRFKIVNIRTAGYLEIEAWLETGVKQFDDMVKTSTYAIEKCGPWIIQDAEGRKYNIQRYAPKYLRHTDFYEFVKFFELYLNTVYTNMTKGTNISILEKIAKIGDFNDIDRIEHNMIWHYAKQFGMEYNIDLQTMIDLNLGFHGDGVINSRTEDDVIDILKYALKNLPMYNQLKGSEKGMVFAMKMFSLSCKVINLWCKLGPEVEEHPDFVEEDRMFDFTSHFLTSRFNLEFNSLNVDFPTFNDNLEVFVRFIKSIKPIVRILNLIKYTIIFEYDLYWLTNPYVHDDFGSEGDDSFQYDIVWNEEELEEMYRNSQVDWRVMHADRIWINFVPADIKVKYTDPPEDDTSYNQPNGIANGYTLFATLLNESRHKFIFKMEQSFTKFKYDIYGFDTDLLADVKLETITIDRQTTDAKLKKLLSWNYIKEVPLTSVHIVMCDSGFFIYPQDGETATYLADFVKPTYYLNDVFRILTEDARKLVAAKQAAGEEKYKAIDLTKPIYIRPDMDVINEGSTLTMKSRIIHVPGTEICYCEPDPDATAEE